MTSIKDSLERVGLSHNEVKVYLFLVDYGQSKAGRIAKETGIQRSSAYAAINSLTYKGLISYAKVGEVKFFQGTSPERLIEFIKEKEEGHSKIATLQKNIITKINSQSKDRHKQVECQVCLRKMRSDTLKRHMLKHRELHSLDEDEIRDEIKRRKKLVETREDREQLVRQIAEEEGLSPEYYCDIETPDAVNPISVEKEIMDDDQIYSRTIERGKIITTVLEKGNAREDSLSKDNRDALKMYRKQMSTRNLCNIELLPWQQQLMDNISTPSDREII